MHVYLHIGTHKTGSTSIQYFLDKQAEVLLNKKNVLYPKSGQPKNRLMTGQHFLPWFFKKKKGVQTDQCWQDLIAELKNSTADKAIISSEDFQNLTPPHIAQIKEYLKDFEVTIIVYLRNPIKFMVSAYKQHIKSNTTSTSFQDFVEVKLPLCDYATLLDNWAQHLGLKNINVRIFDKVIHQEGLIEDFLNQVNVTLPTTPFSFDNISPSDTAINFIRILNKIGGKKNVPFNRFIHFFRRHIVRQTRIGKQLTALSRFFVQNSIPVDSTAEWLRRNLADSQSHLFSKYIAPDDQQWFKF